MNVVTLPTAPIDYGNFFSPPDNTDESFIKSRSEANRTVFQSCSDFIKKNSRRLADLTTHDTSSTFTKSTGQCLVDPATEIRNAKSITTLIAIAREWISDEIANSLTEISDYPLEKDELPLDSTSAKNFLLYSFAKGLNKPILTATHDGLLQADWDNEEGNGTVAIRFLASDKAWVTSRTDEMKGTVEIKLSSLLASITPLNLPSWANE